MKLKTNITSAAGIISLLDEPMPELKIFALRKLDCIVDEFWPEISESIEKIEMLHEDKIFGQHQLAALVASKVFYHLGSFEDALTYALGAGELFDVNARNEYVDTIIAKCIDFYIQQRIALIDRPNDAKTVDERLEAIVNRMIQRCLDDGQYRQALGIALETRRMDIFEAAIMKSDDINAMLAYAFQVAMGLIQNRGFRNQVLRCLVTLYRSLAVPDYVNMCQCLIFLEDPMAVAELLDKLITSGDVNVLMGYQIAFDLYESATQQFLTQVLQALRSTAPIPSLLPSTYNPQGTGAAAKSSTTTATTTGTTTTTITNIDALNKSKSDDKQKSTAEKMEEDDDEDEEEEDEPLIKDVKKNDDEMSASTTTEAPATTTTTGSKETDDIAQKSTTGETIESLSQQKQSHQQNISKLINILSGEPTIDFQVQFLIRSNHADLQILRATKEAVRVSICHTATVIANAFMHSGTTSDQFLRDNLEWLARATNWAKLTATASLGVIHRGHEYDSLALMQSYLPKETGPSSGYSEGGGLYALGLIHANHGANIIDYLLQQLKDAQNENVRHGGCLGLGLAAMGTHRQDLYEQLKFNLYQDDAVTGEAAGIAMGMVMLGSKNAQAIEDMVSYAQETQHEKILRGLAVGIALTMYARLEEAEALVTNLANDKDPVLRRSGMYTLAMAYCGTGSNKAIRKLLHVAVSDVNDDVRRAAVTSIGFILFRTPEQCPSVVSLLAESYNPHVRYGAAMALGIACAGTGLREAIALLEPMVKFDPVNFVRQGALIASAMILIQHTDQTCPKTSFFRLLYSEVITNKHEDVMAKYGAILAQGIIDAGGRNVTVSLQSRTGHTNLQAVVGMLVFTQYWYWFPLAHCLSLAFTPTCIIGLNSDLNMPKIEYKSAAKPSLYAYPPPLEEKKTEEREKVATAVLSLAARQKRRETSDKKDDEKMEVDEDVKEVLKDAKDAKDAKDVKDAKDAKDGGGSGGKDVQMEDLTGAAAGGSSVSITVSAVTTSGKKDLSTTKTKKDKKDGGDNKIKSGGDDKGKSDDAKDDGDAATTATTVATTDVKKSESKKEPEPNFEMLQNPARVLRQQLKVITVSDGQHYIPLKDITIGGIIVMQHTSAEEQTIIEPVAAHGPKSEDNIEPEPPEPFEYVEE